MNTTEMQLWLIHQDLRELGLTLAVLGLWFLLWSNPWEWSKRRRAR